MHSFAYNYLVYLFTFASIVHEVISFITVLDQGIIPLDQGSVGIQFFIDVENSHRRGTCRVNSRTTMCCLADDQYKECNLDNIYSNNDVVITPQNRKTLIHVYPTLYHYDQVGYCDFAIYFKCSHTRRARELTVNITFDTRLANKKKTPYLMAYANLKDSDCDTLDQDSLRQCVPVNCDLKYSGTRPYYDATRGKCVSVPVCETDVIKELPDIVYVPKSNICRDLDHPISVGDIYSINTGLGVVTESSQPDPYDFKVMVKSNCSTISENMKMLRDLMNGKLWAFNGDTSDYKAVCEHAVVSIIAYILAISGLVLSIFCCLQTTVWCYVKWSTGHLGSSLKNWRARKHKPDDSGSNCSRVNREVADGLLKDVIVRDLPVGMRESMVDICQRIHHEIKQKKRYRVMDLGSQVNLRGGSLSSESSSDISFPEDDDRAKLMK